MIGSSWLIDLSRMLFPMKNDFHVVFGRIGIVDCITLETRNVLNRSIDVDPDFEYNFAYRKVMRQSVSFNVKI